jgi:adenylosuccinate synthase
MDGSIIDFVPSSIKEFEKVKPVYLTLPGWTEDISKIKSFEDLPDNAKTYIKKIEELTKTEVALISVGPDRLDTIKVKDIF